MLSGWDDKLSLGLILSEEYRNGSTEFRIPVSNNQLRHRQKFPKEKIQQRNIPHKGK